MLILQMIFIQGVVFIGLVLFLKKVLYSNFSKAMKRLEMLNQETEKKRAELQFRLEQTEKNFQAKQKENEDLAARMREKSENEAEELRQHALAEAKAESDKLMETARNQQDEIKRELEAAVGEKAAHLASDAIRYVFTTKLEQGMHRQLIEDLITEIGKLDGKRLNGHAQEAHIAVPFPLEEKEKTKIAEILQEKAKRKISVVSEVDRSLIAGMVLKFDTIIMDGSLKTKLKEAVGFVRKGEKREE